MKIKDLDIRDMGIFQGEKLNDLCDGIVIIGGLNRAGKTTFMNILRNLGYGFSKTEDIVPPKFEYDIRSRISLENEEKYNIMLKGNNSPELNKDNGKSNITCNEIYNNLDSYTYKQLFTISLDEIGKINNKNDSKLNSVLLGAGLKEIVKIPGIVKNLEKEKDKIGGKRGDPSKKLFKPYYDTIQSGTNSYKKAKLELKEYKEKCDQVNELKSITEEKLLKINNLDNKIIVQDILMNNYENYINYMNLRFKSEKYKNIDKVSEADFLKCKDLYEEYKKIIENYNEVEFKYKSNVSQNINLKDRYLENRDEIIKYNKQLSGSMEKIKNIESFNDNLHNKALDIMNRMKSLNSRWTEFDDILNIDGDNIKLNNLKNLLQKYNNLSSNNKRINDEIQILKYNEESLSSQVEELKMEKTFSSMKWYFIISILSAASGFIIFKYNKFIAAALILIGVVGAGLYTFFNLNLKSKSIHKSSDLNEQLLNVTGKKNLKQQERDDDLDEIRRIDGIFNEYKKSLKLDDNISFNDIKEYYRYIIDFKREINEIIKENKKLKELQNQLNVELIQYKELITKFIKCDTSDIKNDEIFIIIEELQKKLYISQEIDKIQHKKGILENEINLLLKEKNHINDFVNALNEFSIKAEKYKTFISLEEESNLYKERLLHIFKTNRNIEAVNSILKETKVNNDFSKKEMLMVIEELYKEYISLNEVENEYKNSKKLREEMIKEVEKNQDNINILKYDIEKLSSDKTLVNARELINKGRNELYPLAEKYAVYNTAYFILNKIQKKFMDDTKNSFLKKSGEILSGITEGEISYIQPTEDISKCDFEAVCSDGKIYSSTDMLSRGTAEQLFLSVRISRIKEIEPLPVIFDDSFVNFDAFHMKNVIKVLNDLSKTNQIFILTCHSKLVEIVSSICDNVQYWKLEKGNFSSSDSSKLIEYLK